MPKAPAKKAVKAEAAPVVTEDLTQLARLILKLKAKLKKAGEDFEKGVKQTKEDIRMCEQLFAEKAHASGVTSVGTPEGIVGIGKRVFYKSDDITALREFALENGEAALLSMSLSSSGLKEYMERNEGVMPPTVYPVEIEEVYNRPKRTKALA